LLGRGGAVEGTVFFFLTRGFMRNSSFFLVLLQRDLGFACVVTLLVKASPRAFVFCYLNFEIIPLCKNRKPPNSME
jgi:hypothetical protein